MNVGTVLKRRCNFVSALFQCQVPTSYQRCTTLKIRRQILFNFQRRINVISSFIHKVDATLKCWLRQKRKFLNLYSFLYFINYFFHFETVKETCPNNFYPFRAYTKPILENQLKCFIKRLLKIFTRVKKVVENQLVVTFP